MINSKATCNPNPSDNQRYRHLGHLSVHCSVCPLYINCFGRQYSVGVTVKKIFVLIQNALSNPTGPKKKMFTLNESFSIASNKAT